MSNWEDAWKILGRCLEDTDQMKCRKERGIDCLGFRIAVFLLNLFLFDYMMDFVEYIPSILFILTWGRAKIISTITGLTHEEIVEILEQR